MRKIVVTLTMLTIVCFASIASAQYIKPGNIQQQSRILAVDNDALTDGSAFSAPIICGGFNQASVFIEYDRDSGAASDVRMQCYGYLWTGTARGTTAYQIQAIDSSVPALLNSVDKLWKKSVSADKDWVWNIPLNYDYFSCSFTGTGATTDDLTVYVRFGGI